MASIDVLVLGATNELGRAACLRLARDGRTVHAWHPRAVASRRLLGAEVQVQGGTLDPLLDRVDAVLDVRRDSTSLSHPRCVRLDPGDAVVLDPEDGVLRRILTGRTCRDLREPFRWIARDDLVERAVALLAGGGEGVVPGAASAATTTRLELARSVERVRSGGGDGSELDAALASLLAPGCAIGDVSSDPGGRYLRHRRPRRELSSALTVASPLDVVAPFFASAANLSALTPRGLGFRILRQPGEGLHEGATLDYLISLGPLPMPWRTRIDAWEPPHRFVDVQLVGPYWCWWHEHRFEAMGASTRVLDRVLFAPLGGRFTEPLVRARVESILQRIFSFRARAMRLRFG